MERRCLAEEWPADSGVPGAPGPLTAAIQGRSLSCSPQTQTENGSPDSPTPPSPASPSLLLPSHPPPTAPLPPTAKLCKQSDTLCPGHVSLISRLAASNQPFTGLIICNLWYLARLDSHSHRPRPFPARRPAARLYLAFELTFNPGGQQSKSFFSFASPTAPPPRAKPQFINCQGEESQAGSWSRPPGPLSLHGSVCPFHILL